MPRLPLTLLPWLLLAIPACRQPPPSPPDDPHPPEPVVQEDPIAGDPTDIEHPEEIGEEHMDRAKLVEPGPAETEVRRHDDSPGPGSS